MTDTLGYALGNTTLKGVADTLKEENGNPLWLAPSAFTSTLNAYSADVPVPKKQVKQKERQSLGGIHPNTEKVRASKTVFEPSVDVGSAREFKTNYGTMSHMVRRGSLNNRSVGKWAQQFREQDVQNRDTAKPKWVSSSKRDVGWSDDPDSMRKAFYTRRSRSQKRRSQTPKKSLSTTRASGQTQVEHRKAAQLTHPMWHELQQHPQYQQYQPVRNSAYHQSYDPNAPQHSTLNYTIPAVPWERQF
eukprot:TRINITY_DN15217_c0_g1_i1.p1 TRINITY_DN15217_c0_g1~~TRINITY_DN15217_c0_g1_i1.p1  ORF type:complete len:256 (+),score=29.19 TRINITY_DN15217_c0_g1_i1:32-769(+)